MSNLIISENYLKEKSIINGNSDMKVITPTIQLCQDKYIKPILGTDLYDAILTQIGASTVTAENVLLLDNYILPCLQWYILCEVTPVFKYRYANKGIQVNSSENSQSATLEEIQWLMDKWRNNAEWYGQQATKFLREESDQNTYPLYLENDECYKIKPIKNNFTSGLYLGE